MAEGRRRIPGAEAYVRRPGGSPQGFGRTGVVGGTASAESLARLEACAIDWDGDALGLDRIEHGSVERSRHRFRASLPHLIWNAAALEGNTFTLPEVQTLLDGVTVGGKPLGDAEQILALSGGYALLDRAVGEGGFALRKEMSDRIHAEVARHEAIESGHFRGEGRVTGGGTVRLANGGFAPPFPEGEGGSSLIARFDRTVAYLEGVPDPRERALAYFASATRQQFYFDGNKRTARLMMSGELMRHGFDAISIPFARRFEFNTALDVLFTEDDATRLMRFIASCADPA